MTKKIVTRLSIMFTMLVVALGGVLCLNIGKNSRGGVLNNPETAMPSYKDNKVTYAPYEVSIQAGNDNIIYKYVPDVNSKSSATPIAYEYVFNNAMDETAVNLHSMDTKGVNVKFAYSVNERLKEYDTITAYDNFETQVIKGSDTVYIYILVTPIDESKVASFSTKVLWNLGKPTRLVMDIDGEEVEEVIVSGQPVNTVQAPESEKEGYYFDAFYLDEECTNLVTGNIPQGVKLYSHFANLPKSFITYDESKGTYKIIKDSSIDIKGEIIIPALYDDGIHGRQ